MSSCARSVSGARQQLDGLIKMGMFVARWHFTTEAEGCLEGRREYRNLTVTCWFVARCTALHSSNPDRSLRLFSSCNCVACKFATCEFVPHHLAA